MMRGRPAEQEKATKKAKRSPKRAQPTTRRAGKPKAAPEVEVEVEEEPEEELLVQETPPQAAAQQLLVPKPTFVSRNIVAPDGSVRPGWEMWIGDHCFGRADSK